MQTREQANAAETRARGSIYGLFSRILMGEPSIGLVTALESALGDELQVLHQGRQADGRELDETDQIEELAVQYARLFLGPGPHISPHESVQSPQGTAPQLWGEATVAVNRFIERLGVEFTAYRGMLPDHAAVELAVMQKLCEREAEAIDEEKQDDIEQARSLQREFLLDHLGRWFAAFCEEVIASASAAPYYRETTRLARDFVVAEVESVGLASTGPQTGAQSKHQLTERR